MAKSAVTFRIDEKLLARLRKASVQSKDPYAPDMVQVVERGIELALREMEKKR